MCLVVVGKGLRLNRSFYNESVHTESSAHIIWFLRSSLEDKSVLYRVFIEVLECHEKLTSIC